jgi:hypothetical protein
LQGLPAPPAGAREPKLLRNLRDFTGVSARGGVRVAKPSVALVRLTAGFEDERERLIDIFESTGQLNDR